MSILAFFGALLVWCVACAAVTIIVSVLVGGRSDGETMPVSEPDEQALADLFDIWRERA